MVVIDGSALVVAVADTTERGCQVRGRLEYGSVTPHLVDAEVGRGIRGLVLRGELDATDAASSLRSAEHLVVERYPHPPLRPRGWALRHNVSFYDGLYAALAEAVRLPLLTADAKFPVAHGPRCTVELV